MFIVSKTRKAVVNISNAVGLSVRNKKVIAVFENTGEVLLGEYETEERAQEVFEAILEKCFSPMIIHLQRMTNEDIKTLLEIESRPITIGTYYMPEE